MERAVGTIASATNQLDDYVLPRLRHLDAPALAVVGGSTGAGKSTLVNSVISAEVTRPGVLRPTTRAPVLVHHPDDAGFFETERVLPGLARVSGGTASGTTELELVSATALSPGLAVLDAPDIDSVVSENRELAAQLLEAADLWVFVTTAARYADAVPWEFLRRAADRGVALALVLNRIPPGASAEITPHLTEMLAQHGLAQAPTFGIDEQPLQDGFIPAASVAPLRNWLEALAADQATRSELVRRTLVGAVDDLANRTAEVAETYDRQVATADALASVVAGAFERARGRLRDDVRDGTVLRGEVMARWADLVGTGELLRQLQSTLGRWRDRVTAAVTGRPTTSERFQGAIESGIETLLRARVAEATDEAATAWRANPAGASLLAESPDDLARPSANLPERAETMIRDWQGGLLDLLRTEGADKRATARVLSYGLNGMAMVLMVATFAHTGGLTGAEVAIAGGSSAVGQKLVEALLGDQAVRRLAAEARADLDRRTGVLLDRESRRFLDPLAALNLDPARADALRGLAQQLRKEVAT
ncbi:MAG: ABC transporter [Microthrixaceae bacterium]